MSQYFEILVRWVSLAAIPEVIKEEEEEEKEGVHGQARGVVPFFDS